MLPSRISNFPENPLHGSWHNPNFNPNLITRMNVLDYFTDPSNPFYDAQTSLNALSRMQRLNPEQLMNYHGMEYVLYYAQEPLFVIRKQNRLPNHQSTPLTYYYVIGGTVYQAPDLASVVNSRMLNALHSLRTGFKEASSYCRYHPARGYWWDFGAVTTEKASTDNDVVPTSSTGDTSQQKITIFQRTRVQALLGELVRKFPLPNYDDAMMRDESDVKSEVSAPVGTASEKEQLGAQQLAAPQKIGGQPPLKRVKLE